jgi:hypothetical protein
MKFHLEKVKTTSKALFKSFGRSWGVGSVSLADCPAMRNHTIYPPHVFRIPSALDSNGNLYSHFMGYEALVPGASLYIAENARLILNREELFSSGYTVYKELTSQMENPGKYLSRCAFGRELRLDGSVLQLSLGGLEQNYYHFLVEFLARWWVFKQSGIEVNYIVFPGRLPFHIDYLNFLGIEACKVVTESGFRSISADQIIYPSLINNYRLVPGGMGIMNYKKVWLPEWLAELYAWMRTRAVEHWGLHSGPAKLYVTRRKALTRRILNEIELLTELSARGFAIIDCEEMSVARQMVAFSNVRVVVAPHGAVWPTFY